MTESITASAAYAEIPDDSLSVYIGFQASELFYRQHSRFPGSLASVESVEEDYVEMKRIASGILTSLEGGNMTEELENALKELYALETFAEFTVNFDLISGL